MRARINAEAALLSHHFPEYKGEAREMVLANMTSNEKRISRDTLLFIWEDFKPSKKRLETFANAPEAKSMLELGYKSEIPPDGMIELLEAYFSAAWNYEGWLDAASDDEIREAQKVLSDEARAKSAERAGRNDFYAWFNHPDCDLDEDYWNGMDGVSPAEAAAIFLKKDPRVLTPEKLGEPKRSVGRSLFIERFARLRRSAEEHVRSKGATQAMSWKEYLAWADAQVNGEREKNNEQDGRDDARVTATLNKLLSIMILKAFDLTEIPDKEKLSSINKIILDDLKRHNMPLHPKTISARLELAFDTYRNFAPKKRIKGLPESDLRK